MEEKLIRGYRIKYTYSGFGPNSMNLFAKIKEYHAAEEVEFAEYIWRIPLPHCIWHFFAKLFKWGKYKKYE